MGDQAGMGAMMAMMGMGGNNTSGNNNYKSRTHCGKCNLSKEEGETHMPMNQMNQSISNFRTGDWMCKCGAHNFASKSSCFKCGTTKEEGEVDINQMPPPNFRTGDWMCQHCGNHNYASRTSCGKCHKPKDDKEKSPARATDDGRERTPPRE